jgi:ribonucleoside-diphosphate reductase alpha chain
MEKKENVKCGVENKVYTHQEAIERSLEYFNNDSFAASVFVSKYALRDNKGNILESDPDQMHRRLAREFARIESKYSNPLSEEEIYEYFKNFRYIVPQGSPMSAIGNPFQIQSCSNCFVIPSPEDSYGGILKTDQEQAQIMKRRGGVGFDISLIRPRGLETKNAARTTDGIGVFMERFSNTCREVAQNGRRGALMLTISCHHPEIRTFINIKKDLAKVTGANISIRLTDEFMNAVKNKTDVELRWPVNSKSPKISERVDAVELWKEIIDAAWLSAEPGLLFWDTAQKYTPADIYKDFGYESLSTNPCVTGDTWVMTSEGSRRVSDLIGVPFDAVVDGVRYPSDIRGFWNTGKKKTLVIKTKEGFEIECTPNHKILVASFEDRKKRTEWKEAKGIKLGDLLNLDNHSQITEWSGNGLFEEGYLLGSLVGDGCICGDTAYLSWWGGSKMVMMKYATDLANKVLKCRSDLGSGSYDSSSIEKHDRTGFNCKALKELAEEFGLDGSKNISDEIEKGSYQLYKGILMGWFDTDGTINFNKKGQRNDIRLCSSNLNNLYAAQRMLSRMGIISKIYSNRKEAGNRLMPDGKGGTKEYYCQSTHELVITKNNIKIFHDRIGFADPDKNDKLKKLVSSYMSRGLYAEKYVAEVFSINEGKEKDVYDCHIPSVHRFDANGITVHNCGEIVLSAYDSCRLMCVNLLSFVKHKFTDSARFDYKEFEEVVQVAQRLMDDMIDIEVEQVDKILAKIASDPESADAKHVEKNLWTRIRSACINGRRTGLGITALGDALAALGIRYGSKESVTITEKIYKSLAVGSYRSSCILAKERGAFPIFDAELEKGHPFLSRIWEEAPDVYELYKKHGRRNIANTTTAPTGSVSTLTQTTSGIEPAYMLFYKRRKKINPGDGESARVDFVDPKGDKWQEFFVFHHEFKEWMSKNGYTEEDIDKKANSQDDLPFFKKSPYYKATSNDVDWSASVDIQSVAQKWIDHAISKTCNLPNNASKELVAEVYMKAWESGCKGFTVYRDGCRTGVLVSANEGKKENITKTTAPKRPSTLQCDIHHTKSRGQDFFVIVGLLEGVPYEVFAGKNGCITHEKKGTITKNKRGHYELKAEDGSTIENLCELLTDEQAVITRMISLSLRHGSDISFVVDQLEKSPGDMTNFGKGLARVLKKYIADGTKVSGATCQSCGSSNVVRIEGCLSCRDCGNSKCG